MGGAFARRSSRESLSERFAPGVSREQSRPAPGSGRKRPDGPPRERILRATAATIRDHGYRDTTVAEIAAAAGVSRRTFYNEFPSRSEAFIATYEHGFQQTLAACTPAFLSVSEWPERVWRGAEALTGFMAREHAIAYLGFVECHALGPAFARRVHDTQLAFTLFLEEGYRQRPQAASLSRACSALTAAAIFEVGFQVIRSASSLRMQPLAVYIALAPFIGLAPAGEFVADKVAEKGSDASAAG